jgi:Leucine-rich repeat (LRR) protein
MSSNALSGELPRFSEAFATLQELDLSNQDQTSGFTGSIPEDTWRSLSLKVLNLAGNKLTGTIPALVGNLAVLEEFDVSNNRLNSSLPTELGMLDGK